MFECSWPLLPLPPERASRGAQDAPGRAIVVGRPDRTGRCSRSRQRQAGADRGGTADLSRVRRGVHAAERHPESILQPPVLQPGGQSALPRAQGRARGRGLA
jgi:hypothetical protein